MQKQNTCYVEKSAKKKINIINIMNYNNEIINRFKLQQEYNGLDKPINNNTPIVSVCVQTYNHENYIRGCLEGIINQKTNFIFELILGEDDSKDKTRLICIEYANKYPDKIRLFLRNRALTQLYDNQGQLLRRLNGIFTRMSARGKYIALCEGDDFWIDPLKLQKADRFFGRNCCGGSIRLFIFVSRLVLNNSRTRNQ